MPELWSGEALDTILTAHGINLEDVKYRVIRESWDDETRTILEIEPLFRLRHV